jgi:hypothetical protein
MENLMYLPILKMKRLLLTFSFKCVIIIKERKRKGVKTMFDKYMTWFGKRVQLSYGNEVEVIGIFEGFRVDGRTPFNVWTYVYIDGREYPAGYLILVD